MSADHWKTVYATKSVDSLGWYASTLPTSCRLVKKYAPKKLSDCSVIDVGAGASVFVDQMLAEGVADITLLDLSAKALEIAIERVGHHKAITCVVDDLFTTEVLRGEGYDVWHDRAVFHFLTVDQDRRDYAEKARSALVEGGLIVLGTFAKDGPETCNELPVYRCGNEEILSVFSGYFDLLHSERDIHVTPSGGEQAYGYFVLKNRSGERR